MPARRNPVLFENDGTVPNHYSLEVVTDGIGGHAAHHAAQRRARRQRHHATDPAQPAEARILS
jgi:hypothetical protein